MHEQRIVAVEVAFVDFEESREAFFVRLRAVAVAFVACIQVFRADAGEEYFYVVFCCCSACEIEGQCDGSFDGVGVFDNLNDVRKCGFNFFERDRNYFDREC